MSEGLMHIEVAYALPTKQSLVDVSIEEGATVEEVIQASNLLNDCLLYTSPSPRD